MDDTLALGGNIELTGFGQCDRGSMVVIKKIVGNYARKFSDNAGMQKLQLTIKSIHGEQTSNKFEVHAQILTNSKNYSSTVTDHNLFFVLDKAMKKLEQQLG